MEYTSLSQVSHGGVRPLNLSVIHYLIWDCLRKARPTPWGALGGIYIPVTGVPWWGQAFKPFRDSLLDMGFLGEDVFLGRMASAAGGTRRILVVHFTAAT